NDTAKKTQLAIKSKFKVKAPTTGPKNPALPSGLRLRFWPRKTPLCRSALLCMVEKGLVLSEQRDIGEAPWRLLQRHDQQVHRRAKKVQADQGQKALQQFLTLRVP